MQQGSHSGIKWVIEEFEHMGILSEYQKNLQSKSIVFLKEQSEKVFSCQSV